MFPKRYLLVCSRMFDEGIYGDSVPPWGRLQRYLVKRLHWGDRLHWSAHLVAICKRASGISPRAIWVITSSDFCVRASYAIVRELWNLRFLCSWVLFLCSWAYFRVPDYFYCVSLEDFYKFLYCFQHFGWFCLCSHRWKNKVEFFTSKNPRVVNSYQYIFSRYSSYTKRLELFCAQTLTLNGDAYQVRALRYKTGSVPIYSTTKVVSRGKN